MKICNLIRWRKIYLALSTRIQRRIEARQAYIKQLEKHYDPSHEMLRKAYNDLIDQKYKSTRLLRRIKDNYGK